MAKTFISLILLCLTLSGCVGLPPVVVQPQIQVGSRAPARQPKDTGEALFQQAEAAYRRQDYQSALNHYTAYLSRYPQGVQAFRARLREAELTGLVGDWQGALSRYNALLAQNPDLDQSREVRYGIGRAYFKLGQYSRATQVLDSLTATELPTSLRFSTNALLAEIALKQGQLEPAFTRLRLAQADLASGDAEWFDYLKGRLLEQATAGDLERLANLYRDAPLSAALLLKLAATAQQAGRIEEARRWLTTLKERYPGSQEAQTADRLLTPARALLGCVAPLSGDLAESGRRLKQGMELAAQGASLELLFRDGSGEPGRAAQAVAALAQQPQLAAVVGFFPSAEAPAAARAAQEAGAPLLALTQKADLTEEGDLVFQAFLTPRLQVRELVRYGAGRGFRRFAVFAPDSAYGRTFSQLFQEELQAQGGELTVRESYSPGTQDFSLALSPLLAEFQPGTGGSPAFEALFIPDDAATVAAILTQLADNPLRRVQILGTNLVNPATQRSAPSQALEGVVFTDGFFAGDANPAVQGFIAAFRQRYGSTPDYFAAQGYLGVKIFAQLAAAGPLSRAELPRQLLAFQGGGQVPWLRGFTSNRQADLTVYLLTLRGGQVVPADSSR